MINITSSCDVSSLWNYISSYYNFVDKSQRDMIELYWKALMDGLEAFYYNLSESYLSSSVLFSKGYIEDRFQDLFVTLSELETIALQEPAITSVTSEVLSNTVYEYYVTSLQRIDEVTYETSVSNRYIYLSGNTDLETIPNHISWEDIDEANSYTIYSRVLGSQVYNKIENVNFSKIGESYLYEDTGVYTSTVNNIPQINNTIKYYIKPLNPMYYYLSVPFLENDTNGNILEENVDYTLLDFGSLGIYPKDGMLNYQKYIVPQALKLAPIFETLLAQIYGGIDIKNILYLETYSSYTDGNKWETFCNHFIKICHAIMIKKRTGLSVQRLTDVINLYHNVPFVYESGTVQSITESGQNYIVNISNNEEYFIPKTLSLAVDEGEQVSKFQFLCSGITLMDYISDPTTISGMTNWETGPNEYYNTIAIHVPDSILSLNYYKDYIDRDENNKSKLLDNILPPGSIYKYF